MTDPVVDITLRTCLALLIASAAWHKLSDRLRFAATLRAYELLPRWLVSPAASLLALLELSIAAGLLYPPSRELAALAAISLLALYTGAIATNLLRGRQQIDCGCFASSHSAPLSRLLIVRNLVLLSAAALLLMPVRSRALLWVDLCTVAAAVLTLSLLWAAAQHLAASGPALQSSKGPL
jgi:hypothetical protein